MFESPNPVTRGCLLLPLAPGRCELVKFRLPGDLGEVVQLADDLAQLFGEGRNRSGVRRDTAPAVAASAVAGVAVQLSSKAIADGLKQGPAARLTCRCDLLQTH
jgi:hypothetical protein